MTNNTDTLLTDGALADAAKGRFFKALRSYGMSLDALPDTISTEDWRALVWFFYHSGFIAGTRYGFRASAEFAGVPTTLTSIVNQCQVLQDLMTRES